MDGWQRLSEREGLVEPEESLHDGIPPWLRESIWAWVEPQIEQVDYRTGSSSVSEEKLHEIKRRCRVHLDWKQYGKIGARSSLKDLMVQDPTTFLNVIDLLVFKSDPPSGIRLDQLLLEGGSLWKVAERNGKVGLERRVEAAVAEATESAMREGGRAGELLSRAWSEMYGRDPNPSSAYRDSVRAVEAAAASIILPDDPKATLGKMIAAMRAAPSKWRVTLRPSEVNPVESVAAMLELLWKSQHDRHGDADKERPLAVSDAEAEAAVHLAATLVHLFTSGAVSQV